MKRVTLASGTLLALILFAGTTGHLLARGPGGFFMERIADQLTEEQRSEIHDTADAMFEEGASPCEVHEVVRQMVEGYGIELPDHPFPPRGMRRVFDQLTKEQRTEIYDTVDSMFEEGASPCEIQGAVREMVEGYGIELPEMPGRHFRQGQGDR